MWVDLEEVTRGWQAQGEVSSRKGTRTEEKHMQSDAGIICSYYILSRNYSYFSITFVGGEG